MYSKKHRKFKSTIKITGASQMRLLQLLTWSFSDSAYSGKAEKVPHRCYVLLNKLPVIEM